MQVHSKNRKVIGGGRRRRKSRKIRVGLKRRHGHRRPRVDRAEMEAALTHSEDVREVDHAYREAKRDYHQLGEHLRALKGGEPA